MDIKEILKKNIKLDALVVDLLNEAAEPALKKLVEKSDNPYDDMLMNALWPMLEKELVEQIKKLVEKI